ncbi:MAG: cytochrome c biogenesis protein CcsA [Dehalococcoidales bacterium]|nr:cytochrome c biogenesis protein CcsA [Dehalococcoidales bacterium]
MRSRILLGVTTLLMLAALYMVFIYVPTEAETGVIQRIFYFHVPLAWVAFLAFLVVFVASIRYLWKRDKKWDFIASSSAEVGLVFTTLVLITGSIWARPTWGAWWVWDSRLTSSLVLWLIYLAYFIVRSYIGEEERRARFAAVVGVIGFIDVPVVALAITLWRTQHPGPVIFESGLSGEMMATLMVAIAAFTALYFLLFTGRVSLKKDEDEAGRLKASIGG